MRFNNINEYELSTTFVLFIRGNEELGTIATVDLVYHKPRLDIDFPGQRNKIESYKLVVLYRYRHSF